MISPQDPPKKRVSRGRVVAGASVVLAAAVAFGAVTSAIGARAHELGKTRQNARPACSGKAAEECQITGQVTGFQRSVDGKGNLFKAPSDGKIVAWSVDLAKPSKEERQIFGEAARTNAFGRAPTAGISILRRKGNSRFRLQRASPILRVKSYFGERPVFTLDKPLRINEGNVVALTTATWLPAFSFKGQTQDDVWVASRKAQDCEVPPNVPADERLQYFFAHTKPHRKVGNERKYACEYDQARLLYWAYFVPKR